MATRKSVEWVKGQELLVLRPGENRCEDVGQVLKRVCLAKSVDLDRDENDNLNS